MSSKQVLREVYLQKRLTLAPAEYKLRNKQLLERLLNEVDFGRISTVHLFLSMVSKKEVDTEQLISVLNAKWTHLKIIVPKTKPKGQLEHYYLNQNCHLVENNWGIPEPLAGDLADISTIDLVLVPLIISDKNGHRIGYGKGFYDRFLKQVPHATKIGLSLLPTLDRIEFAEKNDVPLHWVLTPFETIRVSKP